MGLLLLVAGLIAIAGGLGAFAYGVVDPAFGRLHTTAATIAAVGGFGLLGLGALISRVRRLAEAIEAQTHLLHSAPGSEPRLAAAASMGAAAVAAALGEPLASAAPVRELSAAPVVSPPARNEPPEPCIAPLPGESEVELSAPNAPEPSASERSAPEPTVDGPTTDAAATKPAEWPSIDPEDRAQPAAEASHKEPPAPLGPDRPSPPRTEPVVLGFDAIADLKSPEPPSGPQVLKSGVIEGMAYTLFSDGSVDAELPEGTRHFASIAEWRSYLREGV